MIMIRTKTVDLTNIPAIAYKQKLTSGGSGITLLRKDSDKKAIATINKRDGSPVPRGAFDENLFPISAFEEAIRLTTGLPYGRKESVNIKNFVNVEDEKEDKEESIDENDNFIITSEEYESIIAKYSDSSGKFSYQLLNKDCIQFAERSTIVNNMISEKSDLDDIIYYIIQSKIASDINKKEALTKEQLKTLISILDDISTRSAFKELKEHIKRKLAYGKK